MPGVAVCYERDRKVDCRWVESKVRSTDRTCSHAINLILKSHGLQISAESQLDLHSISHGIYATPHITEQCAPCSLRTL